MVNVQQLIDELLWLFSSLPMERLQSWLDCAAL
jgi:hypothetical protein